MELTKLVAIAMIGIVLFIILCMIFIKLMNKYLVLQHNIRVVTDRNDNVENFTITSGIDPNITNDTSLKLIKTCSNKSLNDIHETGTIEKKPWATMQNHETSDEAGGDKFYKKYKPYRIPEQDISGIQGANYMTYNSNPNPYHLDFALFDKKDPPNKPVGVNYSLEK